MTNDSESASPVANAQESNKPKRRRIGYACDRCRLKKNRCDGDRPTCGSCRERQQECVYSPQRSRISVTQEYVDDLKMRNEMLEKQLAATQRSNLQNYSNPMFNQEMGGLSARQDGGIHENGGIQYSSLPQIPPQPIHQHQVAQSPMERQTAGSDATHSLKEASKGTPTEYFGESSTFDFMAKVGSPDNDPVRGASAVSGRQAARDRNTSLAASSTSAPIFEFLGGTDGSDPFELPSRFVADRLVDAYFKYRHPLNTYLHEETFRHRYRRIWLSQDLGGEEATQQSLAWFGLVNLVFAFGSDHAQVTGRSAGDRSRYFKRAKTLIFSGLLQSGSVELVQALLLMGQYLHGSLELNNCWTVVGLAIRTAQGLGLHLDPSSFTSDIIEQEVRKRVWWGCFVLDRVLSMKVGRPTIHDGPSIEVGMPLAIDDEFLSNEEGRSMQPQGTPSKLEYFNQIIPQCRLMEKILETLYNRTRPGDSKQKALADTPQFLALSIELDGELVTWQENLPNHLKPGAQASEWHFERQRNVLMMRFLHARHLIHRQTLLLYITRRVTDQFQQEIMRTCVKRCITAAYDSITQMGTLNHQKKLSSFWHNSHYVFAALGVLLVYQTIDPKSRADIGLHPSMNIDQTIQRGLELLQRVGGQMHPLASRYSLSIQQLQDRLHALANSSKPHSREASQPLRATTEHDFQHHPHQVQQSNTLYQYPQQIQNQQAYMYPGYVQDAMSLRAGFEDDFADIENMLMDGTGWTGLMDDWGNSSSYARFTYNGFP